MTNPSNSANTIVDPNPPGYVDETSRAFGNYGKPFILNKIFDLLVLMIDVLQRTAAAQANRLNFLTQWQKAYTDELNQIHSFTGLNGDGEARGTTLNGTINMGDDGTSSFEPHGGFADGSNDHGDKVIDKIGSDAAGKARGELNSTNSIYTQEIQGNLNVISNDAKALQANVNQSNDAVQSQSDMATSILQQMSTILTSIYQSA